MSNPSLSRSGARPLWLTVYMLSIGLLIGLVVSSSMGVLRRSGETAVLFSCGFLSMLAYYRFYRRRPEIFASAVLIGLAMVVFCANEVLSTWLPSLQMRLAFVWYELLSPVAIFFIAAVYPTIYRWRQGRHTAHA